MTYLRKPYVILASLLVVAFLVCPVMAQDPNKDVTNAQVLKQVQELRKLVFGQQKQIEDLRSKVANGEGGSHIDWDRARLSELVKQEVAKASAGAWYTKWKLKGDFRYRHEMINDGRLSHVMRNRNRHRVRLRLGAFAEVNDEWDVGMQLATGNSGANHEGSPTSTNQTLDNWWSTKNAWWDLMYARYRPRQIKNLQVIFGKMKFPFYKAGGSDLIWDSDLRPEGIAGNYHIKPMDNVTVFFGGGGFWLDERQYDAVSNDTADTSVWMGQVYGKLDLPQIAKKVYVLTGVSYYDFANVEGFPTEPNMGLGLNTGDIARGLNRYAMDYNIWNPFVEVGFPVCKLPVKVFTDFAVNTRAEHPVRQPIADNPHPFYSPENNFAWMVGFQVGAAKNPGQWEFKYNYRDIEDDAVVAGLNDADFAGGGTGAKGHKFAVGYCLSKNVSLSVTYFCTEPNVHRHELVNTGGNPNSSFEDDEFYQRLQVDLKLKF